MFLQGIFMGLAIAWPSACSTFACFAKLSKLLSLLSLSPPQIWSLKQIGAAEWRSYGKYTLKFTTENNNNKKIRNYQVLDFFPPRFGNTNLWSADDSFVVFACHDFCFRLQEKLFVVRITFHPYCIDGDVHHCTMVIVSNHRVVKSAPNKRVTYFKLHIETRVRVKKLLLFHSWSSNK